MTPSVPSGHSVLIVEDEPKHQERLREIVLARGDRPRVVGTVDAAIAALEAEDFCYLILDQQLPARPDAAPLVGGGERCMTAARKRDRRRTDEGFHVTPILVFTGYSQRHDFVGKMYDLGADGFLPKDEGQGEDAEAILDRIRLVLGRAGRADHDRCAPLALPRRASVAPGVRLVIDGTKDGRRTRVTANGAPCDLPDGVFAVLLRFVVARLRGGDEWSSRDALGIGESRHVLSRLRAELRAALPEGVDPVESDHSRNFRLRADVIVERVDWDALERHPDPAVQKIAKGARGRS